MKKFVLLGILAVGGSAFAASNTYVLGGSGASISGGQGAALFSASAAIGADKVLGDLGARGSLGFSFVTLGGTTGLGVSLGADLLYPFGQDSVKPYVGAGVGMSFGSSGSTAFNVHGILGADFAFTPTASIFAELTPAMVFGGGSSAFNIGGRAGIKVFL